MIGPTLKRGMTYKKLAKDFATKGNTQLASVLSLYPSGLLQKKRGRPKGSKNKVAAIVTTTKKQRIPKMIGPTLKRGMTYKKLAKDYSTAGNTQLEAVLPLYPSGLLPKKRGRPKGSKNKVAAIVTTVATTKKQRIPKMIGPTLKRGMTYKKLAKDFASKGNTQLASVLSLYPSGLPLKKPRKQRSDKGKKRGPRN